jgi:hypothetical protein
MYYYMKCNSDDRKALRISRLLNSIPKRISLQVCTTYTKSLKFKDSLLLIDCEEHEQTIEERQNSLGAEICLL